MIGSGDRQWTGRLDCIRQRLQDGYWWNARGLSVVGGMNQKFKLIGQLVENWSIGNGLADFFGIGR